MEADKFPSEKSAIILSRYATTERSVRGKED
jgi:hypothetical protein